MRVMPSSGGAFATAGGGAGSAAGVGGRPTAAGSSAGVAAGSLAATAKGKVSRGAAGGGGGAGAGTLGGSTTFGSSIRGRGASTRRGSVVGAGGTGRTAGGAGPGSGSISWASITGGSGATQPGTTVTASPTSTTWSPHEAANGPSRMNSIRASIERMIPSCFRTGDARAPSGATKAERGADSGRLGGRDGGSATFGLAERANGAGDATGESQGGAGRSGRGGREHAIHLGPRDMLGGRGHRAMLAAI